MATNPPTDDTTTPPTDQPINPPTDQPISPPTIAPISLPAVQKPDQQLDSTENQKIDQWSRRLREWMAAGIAGVIVGGTMLLAVISLFFVGKPEDFGRAKDILLFINPFLGVVIGFYFNKVSSEARAENAESNARVATATAQQASQERTVATVEAERAKADAQQAQATTQQVQATNQELSTTLNDVTLAASDVLQQAPAKLAPVPGTLGGGGDNAQANAEWEAKRRRLEEALGRARRMPR